MCSTDSSNVKEAELSAYLGDILRLFSGFNCSFVDVSWCFRAYFEFILTAIRRLYLQAAATLLQRVVVNSNNVSYSSASSRNNIRQPNIQLNIQFVWFFLCSKRGGGDELSGELRFSYSVRQPRKMALTYYLA